MEEAPAQGSTAWGALTVLLLITVCSVVRVAGQFTDTFDTVLADAGVTVLKIPP